MGVPARLGSRPVPFRRVSHRSPPAIHSSFSQPARPTACQCPTARRTVCTQKRSGSPSLPPSDYPRHVHGSPLLPHFASPTVALVFLALTTTLFPFLSLLRLSLFSSYTFSFSVSTARHFFTSYSVTWRSLFSPFLSYS